MGALARAADSIQCRREMLGALERAAQAWKASIKQNERLADAIIAADLTGRWPEDLEDEATEKHKMAALREEATRWKLDAVEGFRRMVENAAAGLVLDLLIEVERRATKDWAEVVTADGSDF